MYSLVGTYVKNDPEEVIDKKTVAYPFTLEMQANSRTFYALRTDEKQTWVTEIKRSVGYSNLFDYYELKVFY